jgi:hypothetical protein
VAADRLVGDGVRGGESVNLLKQYPFSFCLSFLYPRGSDRRGDYNYHLPYETRTLLAYNIPYYSFLLLLTIY